MLPSLCRLCIITEGSRRESDMEDMLVGCPRAAALFADWRWNSSSSARRLRFLKKKNRPPMTAPTARMPTIIPAAIPALLDPFELLVTVSLGTEALVCPGAVTTTVLAFVTTDGGLFLEVSGLGVAAAGGFDVAGFELESDELELELESES